MAGGSCRRLRSRSATREHGAAARAGRGPGPFGDACGPSGQVHFGTFQLPWGRRHALVIVLGYLIEGIDRRNPVWTWRLSRAG